MFDLLFSLTCFPLMFIPQVVFLWRLWCLGLADPRVRNREIQESKNIHPPKSKGKTAQKIDNVLISRKNTAWPSFFFCMFQWTERMQNVMVCSLTFLGAPINSYFSVLDTLLTLPPPPLPACPPHCTHKSSTVALDRRRRTYFCLPDCSSASWRIDNNIKTNLKKYICDVTTREINSSRASLIYHPGLAHSSTRAPPPRANFQNKRLNFKCKR